jgi:type I restriction enzyme S subunit
MTRFGAGVRRVDERRPGIALPLLSVSQTRGVLRQSELSDRPPRADSLDDYKISRQGDVVFNKMSIRSGAMGVASEDGLVTYHYEVMRPINGTDSNYIMYVMKSSLFTGELIRSERGIGAGGTSGVRTTEVPFSVLRKIDVYLPSPDEQNAIARYLDRKTGDVDVLIRQQERLISTLAERRQAVISHAVTKGLNPDVPMKETDGVWFPVIPHHWALTPCRSASSKIQTGPFGSQLHSDQYISGGTPVINPSHIVDGSIVADRDISVDSEQDGLLARHRLQEGDIVAARRGEMGRCAVVRENEGGYLCGTGSLIIRLKPTHYMSKYFQLIFSSGANRAALMERSIGATMDNLNADIVARLRLPKPPIKEQLEIVAFLDRETAQIDRLSAKARKMIDVLKERRQALISAAVTGQMDIRRMS